MEGSGFREMILEVGGKEWDKENSIREGTRRKWSEGIRRVVERKKECFLSEDDLEEYRRMKKVVTRVVPRGEKDSKGRMNLSIR